MGVGFNIRTVQVLTMRNKKNSPSSHIRLVCCQLTGDIHLFIVNRLVGFIENSSHSIQINYADLDNYPHIYRSTLIAFRETVISVLQIYRY